VAPEDSQICGGHFPKRKKIGRRLVPILRMVTIEIVINSTRVMGIRVTISCRYCIALRGDAFVSSYRQDAAKRQTAGIKFTHRPKIRFFAPQGRLVDRFRSNLAGQTGTWVRLVVQNFISIGAGGGNVAPKISKISTFW